MQTPRVTSVSPPPRPNYGPVGNQVAARLRTQPPEPFTFSNSSLQNVTQLLASSVNAWIPFPFVGLPAHSLKSQQLVSLSMDASPFAVLEAVGLQHGIKLNYVDGVWFIGRDTSNLDRLKSKENENELIGTIYQLRHDPVERVDFANSARNQTTEPFGESLPLQTSQKVFSTKAPRIVDEIRVMLGMRPLQYDQNGQLVDPETSGGYSTSRLPILPFSGEFDPEVTALSSRETTMANQNAAGSTGDGAASAAQGRIRTEGSATTPGRAVDSDVVAQAIDPVYVPPMRPQVIYNADTNILWVVATRKQHHWVADYLSRVDKPQDLIAIEVKFFETLKNPQTDFGINWENTLGGDGLTFNATAQMNPSGVIRNGSATFAAPYSAVLSMDQASVAIQAFARDRQGSLVQYPRALTINNREVAIASSENEPINQGVQNVSSGSVGGQNVGSVQYFPTGTQINILPKAVGKDQIAMTIAITISSVLRRVPLDLGTGPNLYPVTAERVYNASLQVNSGYTLAVGGLEKSLDEASVGGIPLLKDIPGVGYLFKNKGRQRQRSNLIIFITPYLISDPSRTPGISENPKSTLPVRPGLPPPAPTFAPDGRLVGGEAALPGAFSWLEYQLKYFRQISMEARDDPKTISELRAVIERARAVASDLEADVAAGAGYAPTSLLDNSARADALLFELNKVLAAARLDQFQLKEGLP
jgi:hypothetical protein